jgi:hypothetical protein
MQTITLEEIEAHRPDALLPPDAEFAEEYAANVRDGRALAKDASVAFVAICRNAQPWLERTLALVEETGEMFREWSAFIFENDSADDTKGVLSAWADGQQRHASLNINHRPHLNFTTAPVRTHALAEYRAACQTFVRNSEMPDYVIVFDTDPWGGWSVDGIATSLAFMDKDREIDGLASYSWAESPQSAGPMAIHYDAFAARLNHWKQRDQNWFHLWHPPVGSSPVPFRSAFGQLAIYRTEWYLRATYSGEDCEHVCLHRSIPSKIALNPSMRCVSFWIPDEVKRGG